MVFVILMNRICVTQIISIQAHAKHPGWRVDEVHGEYLVHCDGYAPEHMYERHSSALMSHDVANSQLDSDEDYQHRQHRCNAADAQHGLFGPSQPNLDMSMGHGTEGQMGWRRRAREAHAPHTPGVPNLGSRRRNIPSFLWQSR